jgi:flagellar biosynthetic protein FlhB
MSDQDEEKVHDPTPRRLEEARHKGEVGLSADFTAAAAMGGFVLACAGFGGGALHDAGSLGQRLIEQADPLARSMSTAARAPLGKLLSEVLLAFAPLFLLPTLAAVAALVVQRAVVFAPDRLVPRLDRLSPIAGASRRFGIEGLAEFVKSALKLGLVSAVLAWFLQARLDDILGSGALQPAGVSDWMVRLSMAFLSWVLLISLILGVADWLWQRHRNLMRLRMGRQELVEEHRQSEGDPHAKATRRQRGQELAMNRSLADVPKADVVIVNPTHFAVALAWDGQRGSAPICLAKGADALAARIRERAIEAGVPLRRDPPTARAIYATVEIGQEVRPEHYRAVAASIRFANAMRRKGGKRP